MEHKYNNLQTIQDYYKAIYPYDKDVEKRVGKAGYYLIKLKNHPMSHNGWVLEHRAVIEQQIGRFLYHCEQVHHIDADRKNNDPTNLKLYATQTSHMLGGHSNSKLRDSELVKLVLEAADDPNIALSDLPCAPVTARKILAYHEKKWISPATFRDISEEELREALLKVGKSGLAEYFGCAYQTIWRRFPHILVERKTPWFLVDHKEDICRRLLQNETFRHIGEHYGTSPGVVSKILLHWSTNGDLPIAVVRNVNARPKCKLKL